MSHPLLSPRQRTAGPLVEDVKVIVRESHPHVIADRGTLLRRQEDANLDACVLESDQSVIPKEFDEVDIAIDYVKGVGSTRGAEVSGPDPGDDRLRAIKVEAFAINEERRRIAARRVEFAPVHVNIKEVHRRRADEGRDELTVRALKDFARRANLLDQAVAQKNDAVGQRHRLKLVMGDIDCRRFEPLMQSGDLDAHMIAELGVEVRKRLVEQKNAWRLNDGASDRDALLLAAGERCRFAIQDLLEAKG